MGKYIITKRRDGSVVSTYRVDKHSSESTATYIPLQFYPYLPSYKKHDRYIMPMAREDSSDGSRTFAWIFIETNNNDFNYWGSRKYTNIDIEGTDITMSNDASDHFYVYFSTGIGTSSFIQFNYNSGNLEKHANIVINDEFYLVGFSYSSNLITKSWALQLYGNKAYWVGYTFDSFPDNCFHFDESENMDVTSYASGTYINMNFTKLSNYLQYDALSTYNSKDSSQTVKVTNSGHSNYTESDCVKLALNGTSSVLSLTILNGTNYANFTELIPWFQSNYRKEWSLQSSINAAFDDATINDTILYSDESAGPSWALINETDHLYIPYVGQAASASPIGLLMSAYSTEEYVATATISVSLLDCCTPPYNVSIPSTASYIAGTSDATFNLSTFFGDTKDATITDFAVTDSTGATLPCFSLSGTMLTIKPSAYSSICSSVTLNVTATDSDSMSVTVQVALTISNQVPVLLGNPSPLVVYQPLAIDHTIDLTAVFKENDLGQSLSYSVTGKPAFVDQTISGDSLRFNGTASTVGVSTITITASDGFNSTDATFTLTVKFNNPPQNASMSDTLAYVAGEPDKAINLASYFSDTEDTTVAIFSVVESSGTALTCMSISGTILTIKPSVDDANCDSTTLNITATDSMGKSVTVQVALSITNQVPVFLANPAQKITYGDQPLNHPIDLTTVFREDDSVQSLSYTVTGMPVFLSKSASGNTLTFTGTPTEAQAGTYDIIITASDGYDSVSATFKLEVKVNTPPQFLSTGLTFAYVAGAADANINLPDHFSDTEDTTVSNFAVVGSTGTALTCISLSGTTLTIKPSVNDANCDSATLNITATDSMGKSLAVQAPLSITNQVPVLLGNPQNITVYDYSEVDLTIDLTTVFKEDDSVQSLSYSVSGTPAFLDKNISGDSVTFNGTASVSAIGNHTITITANDGYDTTNAAFTIEVKANTAPTNNDTIPDLIYVAGSPVVTFDLSEYFSDTEESVLTNFTVVDTNSASLDWVVLSNEILKIKPSVNDNDCNSTTLNITVTDSGSKSVTIQVPLAITNQPPVLIARPSKLTVYENQTINHTIDLTTVFREDDSVQSLTYSISSMPGFLSKTVNGDEVTFEGTPSYSQIDEYNITIQARDGYDRTNTTFTLEVINNNPPVSPQPSYSQQTHEGVPGTLQIEEFTDTESDTVIYSCYIKGTTDDWSTKAWLSFDSTSRILSYSPTSTSIPVNLTIMGEDPYNTEVNVTVVISINFKPVVNTGITLLSGKFVAQQASNFSIDGSLFSDENTALMNVTATLASDGSTPSWLIFTPPASPPAGFYNFAGTYPDFIEADVNITLTATDQFGLTNSVNITIEVEANCHSTCNGCFGPSLDDCISCHNGRYLYLSVCKLAWPDGYYKNSSANTCETWNGSCSSCTGSTSYDCTSWFSNSTVKYYSHKGQCITPWPSGYYGNSASQSCLKCHSYCKECYGPLTTQCTSWDITQRYVLVDPDTCQYLTCPELTYYNSSTYSCEEWDTSCGNWFGGSSSSCLDWPYSTFLSSTHMCQTCAQLNPGLKFAPLANTCIEQWGKGFNLGFLECDDGNTVNEDGCDQACKVETDWKWENGTEDTPDSCFSLIGPEAEISSISSTTYKMSIALTEDCLFNNITESDLSITISGPLSPYSFNYVVGESTGFVTGDIADKFTIDFEFLSSLFGNYKETITVTINNKQILQDLDGNFLQTEEMSINVPFQLIVLSESEKSEASSQSSFSIVSLILTFGTSIFIQVVLGGTIEATWLLLGTLQLMSFLPLLNMNLPANFREFSKNLAVLHGEPEAIPNLFEGYYDTLDVEKEPYNAYFELMNFKTEFLLLNSGRKIQIWCAVLLLSWASAILYDMFGYIGAFGSIIRKVDTKLRYGFIIRAISQSYLSMVLSTTLNVTNISWSGENISFMSNIIAMVFAVAMLYVPIVAFNTLFKAPNLNDESFKKRYKTFIIDLKTSNPLCFQFISVFFFRRAVYASAFVIISDAPTMQVIFIGVTVVGMLAYLILVIPYISTLSKILSIMNEVLLLSMVIIWGRFIEPAIAPEASKQIGIVLVGIIIMTIAANWGAIITYGGISFYQKRKLKKKMSDRKERLGKLSQQQNLDQNSSAHLSQVTRLKNTSTSIVHTNE